MFGVHQSRLRPPPGRSGDHHGARPRAVSAGEVAQLCVGVATLLSALATLYTALRGHDLAVSTHTLVNGQSETIQALREAKGHAEGLVAGEQMAARAARFPAGTQSEPPTGR